MRKLIVNISAFCLTFLLSSFSGLPVNNEQNRVVVSNDISPLRIGVAQIASLKASLLYDLLDLEEKGLSKEAFEYAYKGYQQLLKKNRISCPDYLTICDLSQSSRQKRLYVIDIRNNKIISHTYVAHGKNSGGEYARKFSNRPESHQSSLGFYITKNAYSGEHGLSLRVVGLEPGFNDR
ncbi:MAG TPA: murein L,D-transpeptidase catalytic domain family protein, partial [Chitinophagaceae bacterium]